MAINLGSAYGKVELDSSGVKKGVSDSITQLNNLGKAAEVIGRSMQTIGAGMTLGLTVPIVAFFKSSIDSAMEAENALAEVRAVLASTGGVAGMTEDDLTRMAGELQKVTKFSDEQILSGESMLLTFTKIHKDVFPLATEAMLNMAEKFGGVEQASIQLGKALNDPISGVTALRRVGVMLTDDQEKQIKAFMDVNDIASAQKVILDELETEFGGLARAAGETTAGKLEILKNTFDDLKESVGNAFIPTLVKLAEGLTTIIDKFNNLPEGVKTAIITLGIIAGAIIAIIGPIVLFVGTIISAVGSIISIGTTLGGMGISFGAIGTALGAVGTVITGTIIPAVIAFVSAALPVILVLAVIAAGAYFVYWAFKTNFMGITTTAKQLWFILQYGFSKLWEALKTGVTEALGVIQEAWTTWIENTQVKFEAWREWIQNAWQRVLDFFGRVRNYIVNIFSQVDWASIGRAIVWGLANGMLLGIPNLILAATKAGQAALAAIKKTLGISSPSAVMFKVGMQTAQGYLLGMKNMMDSNAIANALARPVTSSTNSQQQNITLQFPTGLTIRQVQEMLIENNDRLFRNLADAIGGV